MEQGANKKLIYEFGKVVLDPQRGVRQKIFEIAKLNEQKPSTNYYAMARQCALLGDKEQAFEYLNKAVEKRQGQMSA